MIKAFYRILLYFLSLPRHKYSKLHVKVRIFIYHFAIEIDLFKFYDFLLFRFSLNKIFFVTLQRQKEHNAYGVENELINNNTIYGKI
jgi:hypothetical protein